MKIIAINGEDGVGKDTLAKLLFLRLNKRDSSINVFETLKDSVYSDVNEDWNIQHFGEPVANSYKEFSGMYWYDLDRNDKSLYRYKFSTFAQNMKTLFGDNVWVKKLDLKRNTIIPDLRFKVELSHIIEQPHYTIKLEKKGSTSLVNELKNYDKWNRVVTNDGDVEELTKTSEIIYQDLKENYGI